MAESPEHPQTACWHIPALFVGAVSSGGLLAAVLAWAIAAWNLPLWNIAAASLVLIVLAAMLTWKLMSRLSRRGLRITRWRRIRATITVFLAFVIGLLGRPAWHLARTAWNDRDDRDETPAGFVDDASRMNATRVADVWDIPEGSAAAERQLVALLQRARKDGLKVSIAGARHSMGGHTVYPGGIVVNMLPFKRMDLDEETNFLHVQAGARWSEVLRYLDKHGRSVAVMQSNNSFSVGGSISVNCHGWQYNSPPIAASVESFRLLTADGEVVKCSRRENRELFSLALGGYGLFGIILDAELRTVSNVRYRSKRLVVPVDASLKTFDETVRGRDAEMVYARLNIDPRRLFQEVVLNVYVKDEAGDVLPIAPPGNTALRRAVFRGSVGNDYGKWFRWFAETRLQPLIAKPFVSRNQLLSEGVEVFENRSNTSTDILHEYFIPRRSIAGFLDDMRRIIPAHNSDLLNVTVRSVNTDTDTFLRYADQHMFALVMLFHQARTDAGEEKMRALTRDLIDAALARGGRYYLPYRLHATVEQFHRAYPQAKRFFELKRKYDPQELFQNRFYLKYGRPHVAQFGRADE